MGAVLCCCGRRDGDDADDQVEDLSLLTSTSNASRPTRNAPFPGHAKMVLLKEVVQREHCKYEGGVEDYEDCCPTCLEEYTPDNPKIVAECSHHYHLPCIFAWQERSNLCPACSRVMKFESL